MAFRPHRMRLELLRPTNVKHQLVLDNEMLHTNHHEIPRPSETATIVTAHQSRLSHSDRICLNLVPHLAFEALYEDIGHHEVWQ